MKAKIVKLLRKLGVDVLLLGLVEKLLLVLSKKLAEWKELAAASLERCKRRNEKIENCVKN